MTDLLAKESLGPLAPKKPMHGPKAKAVIMLFMEGGPSQVDTFDPKPKLNAKHKLESKANGWFGEWISFLCRQSVQVAQGRPVGVGHERSVGSSCLRWPMNFATTVDVRPSRLNHPEALFHMNTGSRLGGDPALGSWINYGLGTENQNLPGYVVMTELAHAAGRFP